MTTRIATVCWVIGPILLIAGLIALFSGTTVARSSGGESGALAAALLGYLLVGLGVVVTGVALVTTLIATARHGRTQRSVKVD